MKGLTVVLALTFAFLALSSEAWVGTRMRKAVKPRKGFFVATSSSGYATGNFGGISAANTKCLNDLSANNWKGKSEAVLNSSTVKAFLCDSSTCNNLLPDQTYYFAVSGDTVGGGASFTTNSNGQGPGNMSSWTGSAYFNSTNWWFWSGRAIGSDSNYWPLTPGGTNCNNWSSGSPTVASNYGDPASTNAGRWNSNSEWSCNSQLFFICMVNPP